MERPRVMRCPLTVCTDAANEADDAFVVAHALLTPSFDVRCIIAGHLRLSRCGELGWYLWTRLSDYASENMERKSWISPDSWVLGDQAAVGVLLAQQKDCYSTCDAPYIDENLFYTKGDPSRLVRVYHDLHVRLILEDMFTKFAMKN